MRLPGRSGVLPLAGLLLALSALGVGILRYSDVGSFPFWLPAIIAFGGVLAVVGLLLMVRVASPHAAAIYTAGGAAVAVAAGVSPREAIAWLAGGLAAMTAAFTTPGESAQRLRDNLREFCSGGRALFLPLAAVVVQVGLAAAVVRIYHIESQALYQTIFPIAVAGFLILQVVPPERRLVYFILVSLGGFALVLGLTNMIAVLAVAALLLTIVHLRIAFRYRVALVILTGLLMAAFRGGLIHGPVPGAVWPIIGSIFMFRLIVYMYELAHQKEPVRWSRTLAYFFMLPNVVFPFFPAIDFATFRRTWFDVDAVRIYARGATFMFWGIVHLLLYRLVSQHMIMPTEHVVTTADLARYLLANFLLYLRVSGQFHLIVGLLHLFGCHLPETHRQYFISAGFTDLWRRINIYWKDFMLKVFYYPILFRLRKIGPTRSMIVTTLIVFVLTWLFHGYQWFWLRGSWLWSLPDLLFWMILGVLVVVNSVVEMRRGRRRTISGRALDPGERLKHRLAIIGTFLTMMVLWSLWSSPSVTEWAGLWHVLARQPLESAALIAAGLFGALALAIVIPGSTAGSQTPGRPAAADRRFRLDPGVLTMGGFAVLILLGQPLITDRTPENAREVLLNVRWNRLNERDAAQLERGYYEGLNDVNSFNSELWEIYMRRPEHVPIWETEAVRKTDDYLGTALNPNVDIIFRGRPYHTNRWAMRDRDYEKEKPAGACRLALVGDSHTEGWGVGNDENFDAILEGLLEANPLRDDILRVEILNFAVGGYSPPQELLTLERRVMEFDPDAVIVFGHPGDRDRLMTHLWTETVAGRISPHPELAAVIETWGLTATSTRAASFRKMTPDADSTLAWVYNRMASVCREHGARPVWVLVPYVPGWPRPPRADWHVAVTRRAGFEVIDLFSVYDEHDPRDIRVADWDHHPNALGHRLIAESLYAWLREHPEFLTPKGTAGDSTDFRSQPPYAAPGLPDG